MVGAQDRLGTLEVGKLADLVILMDDPLAIPAAQLGEIKVAHTIVNGKVVFERPIETLELRITKKGGTIVTLALRALFQQLMADN